MQKMVGHVDVSTKSQPPETRPTRHRPREELDDDFEEPYWQLLGGSTSIVNMTKPDIVREGARQDQNPPVRHWSGAIKVSKYFNATRSPGVGVFMKGGGRVGTVCQSHVRKLQGRTPIHVRKNNKVHIVAFYSGNIGHKGPSASFVRIGVHVSCRLLQ